MLIKTTPANNFTIIENHILKDNTLSIGARMLYAICQSFNDEWSINTKHLGSLLNVSEAMVRKYRNELIEAGLLEFMQLRDAKGKLTQETLYKFKKTQLSEVVLEETPEAEVFTSDFKESEAQNADVESTQPPKNADSIRLKQNPYTDKFLHNNINIYKNINSNKEPRETFYLLMQSYKIFKDNTKQKRQTHSNINQALEALNTQEKLAYQDFISYRKEKGFMAKSTINSIIKDFIKLKNEGADLRACVDLCINRGWSGIMCAKESLARSNAPKRGSGQQPRANNALANLTI